MCGIFVGIPDDAVGWLFYVPTARRTYIFMIAIFDASFTSPLVLPDLLYQGAIRLRDVTNQIPNQDVLMEYTSDPIGKAEVSHKILGYHIQHVNK